MPHCTCDATTRPEKTETYHLHLDAASGESLGDAQFAFLLPSFGIPIHDVKYCSIQVSRWHLESSVLDNFESAFLLLKHVPQKFSWDSNLNGSTSVIATLAENQVPGAYMNNRERDEPIVIQASDLLGKRTIFQICIASGAGYQSLPITDWRCTIILNVTY